MHTRFESQTEPRLYIIIALSVATVFFTDTLTRSGIATWMFYLVPIALCMFVWRPLVPILVGSICSVLLIAGYVISPAGVADWISQLNRSVGLIVIWTVAIQGRHIIQSRLDVRRDNWLRNGHAQLSSEVIGEQSTDHLSENVLRFLATYLDAQVAAFYVLQADGSLRRSGGFAYSDTDDHARPHFNIGEGLIGEAARQSRAFIVEDLPNDYMNITSGLGTRKPSAMLIAPATADGETIGVIELGFLHPIYEVDIELLNRLAEPMGIALRTSRLRMEREELLEETQRQAEELQTQQEELRVANEELAEQSNALRESQARLETQQAELEQTNAQLEEHTQLLTRHNDAMAEAQRNLAAKAAELERASRYKSEFLANMSHELRTPLNSALILAKLLADNKQGNLSEEQINFANSIYDAGNDLLDLINDILDLSKIEARKVETTRDSIELKAMAEGMLQSFQPQADQKGIALSLHIEPGAPAVIESDSQRLRQILKNLLSNALKFTERGEVKLHIFAAPDQQVSFSVQDTGIGIAPHQKDFIFEPFQQADGTTSRRYGGTGLGLSISRKLAELLDGEITLESTPGSGSTFILTIPTIAHAKVAQTATAVPLVRASAASRSVRPAPMPKPTSHPRSNSVAAIADDRAQIGDSTRVLLVVEDDPAFAKILYDLAHELKFNCLIAPTADEGIDLALQYRPTAIVLDMKLPDHLGLAVLDRLKHDSATRHIPVQVISAMDYTQAALQMGAAGVMLKPVKREELIEALSRLESKSTQGLRSVLVVEDNTAQRESVCRLLDSENVRTVPVATAAAALAQLRETTFDCMVLDLALPDTTGYELLETMAHESQYAFPPVIVYTGRDISPADEQRLRKYSQSIIIKGAKSPERLLDEVSLFLHQVESALPPERQRMLREARNRDAIFDGRRILIVEDDVRNIFALSSVLEPQGAELSIARNGKEALEVLAREPAMDIVLMDIMMPEMDGLTATVEIRKRPALGQLPIIALTAKAMPDDHRRCLEAGASDYISKPVDIDKLLSLIRIWLPAKSKHV
jgi:signal transduction histidine kinase/CheY-like chemotaxis protein